MLKNILKLLSLLAVVLLCTVACAPNEDDFQPDPSNPDGAPKPPDDDEDDEDDDETKAKKKLLAKAEAFQTAIRDSKITSDDVRGLLSTWKKGERQSQYMTTDLYGPLKNPQGNLAAAVATLTAVRDLIASLADPSLTLTFDNVEEEVEKLTRVKDFPALKQAGEELGKLMVATNFHRPRVEDGSLARNWRIDDADSHAHMNSLKKYMKALEDFGA